MWEITQRIVPPPRSRHLSLQPATRFFPDFAAKASTRSAPHRCCNQYALLSITPRSTMGWRRCSRSSIVAESPASSARHPSLTHATCKSRFEHTSAAFITKGNPLVTLKWPCPQAHTRPSTRALTPLATTSKQEIRVVSPKTRRRSTSSHNCSKSSNSPTTSQPYKQRKHLKLASTSRIQPQLHDWVVASSSKALSTRTQQTSQKHRPTRHNMQRQTQTQSSGAELARCMRATEAQINKKITIPALAPAQQKTQIARSHPGHRSLGASPHLQDLTLTDWTSSSNQQPTIDAISHAAIACSILFSISHFVHSLYIYLCPSLS